MKYGQAIDEIVKRRWALEVFYSEVYRSVIVHVHNNRPSPNKYGEQRQVDQSNQLEGHLDLVEIAIEECVYSLMTNPKA